MFFGFWVLMHYASKTLRTMTRERTRREVAAYIAEGSLTPEQGERLLRAAAEKD
jgi:hypothetical protein